MMGKEGGLEGVEPRKSTEDMDEALAKLREIDPGFLVSTANAIVRLENTIGGINDSNSEAYSKARKFIETLREDEQTDDHVELVARASGLNLEA